MENCGNILNTTPRGRFGRCTITLLGLFSFVSLLVFIVSFLTVEGPADAHVEDISQPGAAGLGDSVQPGLGNGGYNVRHYELDLRFTDDLTAYTAVSTLRLVATQALSRFDLDLAGTDVNEVSVGGSPVHWVRIGEKLQITPASPLRRGEAFTVRASVHGTVPDITEYQSGSGFVHDGAWVECICQPSGAHHIAALADHPAQKAPATIIISAPSRLNAIANGYLVGTWTDSANPMYTVRRFESLQKLAPELIEIAIGPFTVVHQDGPDGVSLRYALPTEQIHAIEPQLSVIPEAIRFFEARLGPFPQHVYGILATPIGGELETQSLLLMDAGSLNPQEFSDNGVSIILAHEVSHEYFGNSVSPLRWSDLWLNEGHAVYYENVWAEAHGIGALDDTAKRAYQRINKDLLRYGPVAAPRRSAFSPESTAPYGTVAYQGGMLVLYALRQKVGEAVFDRIERAWVHNYRDNSASTADFISLATSEAGADLAPFLRSWLYSDNVPPMPGHPDWHS